MGDGLRITGAVAGIRQTLRTAVEVIKVVIGLTFADFAQLLTVAMHTLPSPLAHIVNAGYPSPSSATFIAAHISSLAVSRNGLKFTAHTQGFASQLPGPWMDSQSWQ